jgi:pimeloyl-ACP methyl ester carboxylesterase
MAFDHHTLSHDPERNVRELLARLPGDVELDVICHSRGGLVARVLAERPSRFGLDTARARVRRVVFVGVPNAGTQLADPAHMTHFLDRMTSALNLFPGSGIGDVLEGILTAVKVVGHGALKSLDGLAAMNPEGKFLRTLNAGTPDPGRRVLRGRGRVRAGQRGTARAAAGRSGRSCLRPSGQRHGGAAARRLRAGAGAARASAASSPSCRIAA